MFSSIKFITGRDINKVIISLDLFYYFMDNETFEQPAINTAMVGDAAGFLKEGLAVKLTFHGDEPLDIDLPTSVELEVVEAEIAVRGDTATGVTKKVICETGLEVQSPNFIEVGASSLLCLNRHEQSIEFQTCLQ